MGTKIKGKKSKRVRYIDKSKDYFKEGVVSLSLFLSPKRSFSVIKSPINSFQLTIPNASHAQPPTRILKEIRTRHTTYSLLSISPTNIEKKEKKKAEILVQTYRYISWPGSSPYALCSHRQEGR